MTDTQKQLQLNYFSMKNELSYKSLPNFSGIPIAIIKGEPLSVLAYGKSGQRISGDIDILVPKSQLHIVQNMLQEAGFHSTSSGRAENIAMLTTSHQLAPMYKALPPFESMFIDLNFDLFWGEYQGKRIDIAEFLEDTIEIDIYGVKVKTLPPEKMLIQYILHGYKDLNSIYLIASRSVVDVDIFKDIYFLTKSNPIAITPKKFMIYVKCMI